jgi:hypothetical protein
MVRRLFRSKTGPGPPVYQEENRRFAQGFACDQWEKTHLDQHCINYFIADIKKDNRA